MKKSTIAFAAGQLACMLLSFSALSQGCIAIRNLTGFGQFTIPQYDQEPIKWLVNVNSRYSEFHKTFDGNEEKTIAPEDQPFSNTFVLDFALTRVYEKGWSVSVDVPFIAASRKTWQEHSGPADKTKHTTNAFGIGDIRITAYKWLFDVTKPHKGNIQVGLGLKLPTGDYRYQDYFYKPTGRTLASVNSTIQLGDGGTGITMELNSFYVLNKTISLYGNLFYLFSPRDQNGVSNATGGNPGVPFHPTIPSSVVIEAGANFNSVPDAYTLRGGANFTFSNLVLWSGVRWEGSPVNDVIGGENGQRRAGYAVSVEPGVNYNFKRSSVFAFVPIPVYRTTRQTAADAKISELSGEYVSSPGGMADYLIFIGVLFRM